MTALRTSLSAQQGISLLVVMVMLLLCSLLALGAARVGWLNEAMVGNISDDQRAFLAAEILMGDAQRDIQTPDRRAITGGPELFYPLDAATDFTELQNRVAGLPVPCRAGLCFPARLDTLNGTGNTNWWQQGDAVVNAMRAAGATYGQITGVPRNPLQESPLLTPTGNRLAHYWIEAFLLPSNQVTMAGQVSNTRPYAYRVTVVVDGLKAGTRVVLQSIMSP
jgi:Tfp pilus assembly protein PilX